MTETYRQTELTNARGEMDKARAAYEKAKSRGWSAKARDAAETLEFWGNKVAFLSHVKADQ